MNHEAMQAVIIEDPVVDAFRSGSLVIDLFISFRATRHICIKTDIPIRSCFYNTAIFNGGTAVFAFANMLFSKGTPPHKIALCFIIAIWNHAPSFLTDGCAIFSNLDCVRNDGDLELAIIPESFRIAALNETLDDHKVLIENANTELNSFALLFEFDGDQKHIRHVLYNCSASRPGIEGKTNEENREVQTETLTIKATPLATGVVKAKTGDTTDATTYANWYQVVYVPTITDSTTPAA